MNVISYSFSLFYIYIMNFFDEFSSLGFNFLASKVHPDLNIIRKIFFWGIHISKIALQKQYRSVIQSIFEHGNYQQRKEILNSMARKK
jgi:hypothetical protein